MLHRLALGWRIKGVKIKVIKKIKSGLPSKLLRIAARRSIFRLLALLLAGRPETRAVWSRLRLW